MTLAGVGTCSAWVGRGEGAPHTRDVGAAGKDPGRHGTASRAARFRVTQRDRPQRLEGTASVTAIVVGGHVRPAIVECTNLMPNAAAIS